jgi:hypothetical protein
MKRFTLLVLLLLLTGCHTIHLQQQTLAEFIEDAGVEQVEEIVILNGETGEKKSVTDVANIEAFLADIEAIVFTPDENQEQRNGFRYDVKLIDGNETFQFTPTSIGQDYYVTSDEIYEILDKLFTSN